jgi:hypothetical protein
MIETDTWVPVMGFEGYSVNPLGQVRNDFTSRLLNTRLNQAGVPYVGMVRDGHQQTRSLARLVALTFISRPHEDYDTPINLDGDRTNCRVDNLTWRPRVYAEKYNRQFREPYEHPINMPIIEVDTGEEFPNSLAAACCYGILERDVVLSILNHTPTWVTFQNFVISE